MSTSSSYKEFAHLQIPLEEILAATNNFSDANLIWEDVFGKEYKAQLFWLGLWFDIVVRRFDETKGLLVEEFWTEVSMLFKLRHNNIISLLGYCDEKGEKIVITRDAVRKSLYCHLRNPFLTWMLRLKISVSLAQALSYIYYDEGRDFSVIHRDIKSSKILLDETWEAKLSGFELSLYQAAAERNRSCQLPDDFCGTLAYCDPTYYHTRSVSHKSDVFSLGILLHEVLCCKEPEMVNDDELYLYKSIKSDYEEGRLYDLVNPGLRKQMGQQSFEIFTETAYCCLNDEPSERLSIDQIVIQLEKALESQREHENQQLISNAYSIVEGTTSKSLKFAHLQIPLEEILSATNNFSDDNLIRLGGTGQAYRGQLLRSGQRIDIIARRFDDQHGEEYRELWTEVSMLSLLKHKNIVSIIGFCDENGEKIVVNNHETNGILYKYIRDPTLTWMQRLHICVGVAHALSHIYYDELRDFSVIHRDVKSSKILLDEHWEAKLSGFELAITQTASRRDNLCLTTDVWGTAVYCDPAYIQSRSVTHKSDIYSFGMVLFEVLSGKEAATTDKDNMLLASSARSHYERGRLEDMIDPVLWKQMGPQSFKIFSETAYFCLKEQRQQRPNIYQIVKNLEQALESQRRHENPLISKDSMVDGTSTRSLKGKDLKHLEIPLIDIKAATKDFDNEYRIGSGGYGDVYKAELDHIDSEKYLQLKEKNIDKLPKKRSIVAIKQIKIREDQQGEEGFLAELEMLTSCKHPNIVSLHGFCEEGGHMILVYEHASKGSLDGYLGSTSKLTNLSWVQRINICIDIARGLNYLHTKLDDDGRIIHRDIKSDNILLGENWQAKIADFGLSKFRPKNQQMNKTIHTNTLAGTELYWDPEYIKTGKLKNESDIYSFGVVLFEILSGRFANDPIYTNENSNGIAAVARRRFIEGTIREMVDPRLMEETHESIFTLNRGPDQDSLKAFAEIAYRCVAESQVERPLAEDVIRKLEEALSFQETPKDSLKLSLEDIKMATQNFSANNLIGEGGMGKVYKGEITHANGRNTITAKRFHRRDGHGEHHFLMEIQVLLEYKHENIIGFVGYCNEMDERIIVYEYASRKSLDRHLKNNDLTWRKRLQICIDIASGLGFLHGGSLTQEVVIHRDIKSSSILVDDDWKAKISDFGLSFVSPINKDMDFVIDYASGTLEYADPLYMKLGFLTQESDIYSFGVVLIEILCGRLAFETIDDDMSGLTSSFQRYYKEGTVDEIMFEGIKEQAVPQSLTTCQAIAYRCIHCKREERPTADQVLVQLKKALEIQDDYEIWEPKLPNDYKEIISEIYFTEKREDLYHMFSQGILLKEGKVLFSLGGNGERNVMISAKKFSYIHDCQHKWHSVPESRFQVVAAMLDISNLKIKITTRTQLLSPNVAYGVYLVFKFCDPRKVSSTPLYVNLQYKIGSKTRHAYFATWRDNEWMMIELYRFMNDKEPIDFKFLLESFSRCYCLDSTIYVKGIEFRPIIKMKHEEMRELKQVQKASKSDSNLDPVQKLPTNPEEILKRPEHDDNDEKSILMSEVNGKKHLLLSAKAALNDYSNVKLFRKKPSAQSRFAEVVELLPQQVFRINCKIKSQMLSRDTDYVCYLVFNLSKKCHGLHCPVQVRDLFHWSGEEAHNILYFRSPKPWNLHDTNQAPKQRADGWMEVKVWKFNLSNEFENDDFHVKLRLFSYEGTMSGLIVCGLEFRAV